MITFSDFQKLDLRVGKIISAEKIVGSEKLLKLKIDIGSDIRQIVSGIAQFYPPEKLVGKLIVLIVNLEPRKIMGEESQGMILCADGKKPVLLKPITKVLAGTKIC